MFGIEKLREEIYDLKDSVEELTQRLQTYIDEEITFSDMKNQLNAILEVFLNELEDKLKLENIANKLTDILKRLPAPPSSKKK